MSDNELNQVKHAALTLAVERYAPHTHLSGIDPKFIIDSAKQFELYLNGGDADNSAQGAKPVKPTKTKTGPASEGGQS